MPLSVAPAGDGGDGGVAALPLRVRRLRPSNTNGGTRAASSSAGPPSLVERGRERAGVGEVCRAARRRSGGRTGRGPPGRGGRQPGGPRAAAAPCSARITVLFVVSRLRASTVAAATALRNRPRFQIRIPASAARSAPPAVPTPGAARWRAGSWDGSACATTRWRPSHRRGWRPRSSRRHPTRSARGSRTTAMNAVEAVAELRRVRRRCGPAAHSAVDGAADSMSPMPATSAGTSDSSPTNWPTSDVATLAWKLTRMCRANNRRNRGPKSRRRATRSSSAARRLVRQGRPPCVDLGRIGGDARRRRRHRHRAQQAAQRGHRAAEPPGPRGRHPRRGGLLAEDRAVDVGHLHHRRAMGEQPGARDVEVGVAAEHADHRRVVRVVVRSFERAELDERVLPPLVGGPPVERPRQRVHHFGEHLADVAARPDREPTPRRVVHDPCPHRNRR